MTAPDVRVTLTADDLATEVVRRLSSVVKQLGLDQKTANDHVSASAKGAVSSLEGMTRAIEGIVAALGAVKLLEFAKGAIDAAEEIGNLSLKTGISTEKLSALAVAANAANLSTDELNNGLKFLSRSSEQLQAGSVQVAAAFRAIGLSANDLKGLSLDEVLLRVAQQQEKFADGAGKTATMLQIFGRSGQELIPLLHELATTGFDELLQKAAKLGFVLTDQDVKAARDFHVAMTDIQFALRGAVIQLAPMIELFSKFVEKIAEFIGQHPDLSAFAVGASLAAVALVGLVGGVVALTAAFTALDIALAPILIGLGVIVVLALGVGAAAAAFAHAADEAKKFGAAAQTAAKTGLPGVTVTDPAQEKALRDARTAAAQTQAKTELSIAQAKNKQQEELDAAAFAAGLSSLSTFFAERRAIVQSGVAGEVASLNAERAALQKELTAPGLTPADELRIRSQIQSIEGQIATTKVNGQTQLNALVEDERVKRLALQQTIAGFSAQIAKATGDQIKADQIGIAETVRQFSLALTAAGGLSKQQIDEAAASLSTLLTNRAAFQEEQRQGEIALTQLDLQRQAIQARADQGLISQRDAQLQIAAVERDRVPQLQQIAALMLAFAEATKDPALIESAKQFAAQFQKIGVVVTDSQRKLAELGTTLADTAQSDLSNFLGSTISQVHGVADAFVQLGTSIVQSFQRVLGDIVSSAIIDKLRDIFSSSTPAVGLTLGAAALSGSATELTASGGVLLGAAAALVIASASLAAAGVTAGGAGLIGALFTTFGIAGLAGGGLVSGPGTGTSDSILARLSAGEFIMPASAVRKLGLPFLESISGIRTPALRSVSSGVPGFAGGGLVASGGGDSSGSLEATIGLEDGLVVRHLESRGGVRALLRIMNGNPQAFKAALNLR